MSLVLNLCPNKWKVVGSIHGDKGVPFSAHKKAGCSDTRVDLYIIRGHN